MAALILVLGVAAFSWLPRAAAVIAVAGTILFGLVGVLEGVNWFLRGGAESAGPVIPYVINFYGAVPIDGGITELFALVQGVALFGVGCALALRLRTWSADAELAERARVQQPGRRPDHRRDRGAVRVVIGEDLFLLRDGLARLLSAHGFEIAAAVGTAPELLTALTQLKPGRLHRRRQDAAVAYRRRAAGRPRGPTGGAGPSGPGALPVRGAALRP
jgi:hypothetical protein